MKNKNILIHAWTVHFDGVNYKLPYTHWVYLNEIVKYYKTIYLLSPVKQTTTKDNNTNISLKHFNNVFIKELPYSSGYAGAIKHFFTYYKVYKKLSDIDVFYARYPIPFGWLAKVFHKNSTRIIHFVGDPIDATRADPNLNAFKKALILGLFHPEHQMYLWACKGAQVYTNGLHIAERLNKINKINAAGLISSTLNSSDFFLNETKKINIKKPKLIYVGYLRKAKGIETLVKAFKIVQNEYPNAEFSIVGSGEFESQLKDLVKNIKVPNVHFLGHVDNRNELNAILRNHDIFCFGSLSEGSPRVVLEAMANGLAVVSTPVGSLPMSFENEEEILFSDFNDYIDFGSKLIDLISIPELFKKIRTNGFNKVKSYTIEKFIKKIFNDK